MKPGTCIHFTGLRDRESCCRAGLNYSKEFDISRPGIMLRMPCVQYRMVAADGRSTYIRAGAPSTRQEIDRRGETMMPCAQFREPTAEEVQGDRAQTDARIAKVEAGIRLASAWRVRPKPDQNRHEEVECPICKGVLHLSQSSYNGHVSGKCETADCIHWME